MESTLEVADIGFRDVNLFLCAMPETIAVINVEKDKHFQRKDIDLIWVYKYKNSEYMKRVEIKADRYSQTGNYFIETVSNQTKDTKGCFLYTEADFLFYYFVDTKELNVIPMPLAKEWFLANQDRFIEKELSTLVGKGSYVTKGRLVPKKTLNKEVKGVKVIMLNEQVNKVG